MKKNRRRNIIGFIFLVFFIFSFLIIGGIAKYLGDEGRRVDPVDTEASGLGTLAKPELTVIPEKEFYAANERITISLKGNDLTQNIEMHFKDSSSPANLIDSWVLINGNYDNSTKTYFGEFITPNYPTELLITANITDETGVFCSGNPGMEYNGQLCTEGVLFAGQSLGCCEGVQKIIAVDTLKSEQLNGYNTALEENYIDTKEYINNIPGHYWEFSGENFTYPQNSDLRTYKSRIEIEEPVIMCGSYTIPYRFLKDKASGYISPSYRAMANNQDGSTKINEITDSGWAGPYVARFALSTFDHEEKWNNDYIGAVWAKSYFIDRNNPLRTVGERARKGNTYLTNASQNSYYPPYLFLPEYLELNSYPNNIQENVISQWGFERNDNIYSYDSGNHPNVCAGYDKEKTPNMNSHGWDAKYGWEYVETPAYVGWALRLRKLEFNASQNPKPTVENLFLREDWLFGKGIGLVMIKQNFMHTQNNEDMDNLVFANAKMTNPDIEIKLTNYYNGQDLTPVANQKILRNGDVWRLQYPNQYTGYLDITGTLTTPEGVITPINTRSVWVQDGIAEIAINQAYPRGDYKVKFRRNIPTIPNNQKPNEINEVRDPNFDNPMPWSFDQTNQAGDGFYTYSIVD